MKFSNRKYSDIADADWDTLFAACSYPNTTYSRQMLDAAVSTWHRLLNLRVVIGEEAGAIVLAQPVEIIKSGGEILVDFFRAPTTDAIEPLGIDTLSRADAIAFFAYVSTEFSADRVLIKSASARLLKIARSIFNSKQLEIGKKRKGTEIRLPDSADAYWAELKSSHRSLLRRKLGRAEKAGLTFHLFEVDSSLGNFSHHDALKRLTELHRKRFDSLGQESFFVQDDIQSFHRNIRIGCKNSLSVVFVECRKGSDVVGSAYGLASRDDFVFLMTGFDPREENYSIGFLMIYQLVIHSINMGIGRFDLKVGAERYKEWWANQTYFVQDFCVYPNRGFLYGLGSHELSTLADRLRRALQRRIGPFWNRSVSPDNARTNREEKKAVAP